VIIGTVLVLIASAMSYELIEVRFRRMIDGVLRGALFGKRAARSPA